MKRAPLLLTSALTVIVACTSSAPAPNDAATDAIADPQRFDSALDVPAQMNPDVVVGATCRGPVEPAWVADPRLCVVRFATGVSVPRGLAVAPDGDLFVSTPGALVVLFDDDGDGVSGPAERSTFTTQTGLNHGVAFSPDGLFVYASTPDAVYRWRYSRGDRVASGAAEIVVDSIPHGTRDLPANRHITRTLLFDASGRLYVTVGSAGDVDTDPEQLATRSMVVRFSIPAPIPTGGIAYPSGEIIASGMRNEVGLALDPAGRLWGVGNGRNDAWLVPGMDIHNGNPAEELHRIVETAPQFYGYPSCWTEFLLASGAGPGTLHADPEVTGPAVHDDAWCQDAANVRRAAFAMTAHWAPLGLVSINPGVFPPTWTGDLLVPSHGGSGSAIPNGRLIARARIAADGTVTTVDPIVGGADATGALAEGQWEIRPVDIKQGIDGAMYFTADEQGLVLRVGYR